MSRRNVVWLAAIVVVGAAAWFLAGWPWGIAAAVATLVVSEVVERSRRARRRRERGADTAPTTVRAVVKQRRR